MPTDPYEKKKLAWEASTKRLEAEIALFWSRGLFFWTFIAASFVVYTAVPEEPFVQNCLLLVGYMLSYLWTLAMRRSRRWQIVWEKNIKELEPEITGVLYGKPVSSEGVDSGPIRNGEFSVSKIAILIGYIFSLFWLSILAWHSLGPWLLRGSGSGVDTGSAVTLSLAILSTFALHRMAASSPPMPTVASP